MRNGTTHDVTCGAGRAADSPACSPLSAGCLGGDGGRRHRERGFREIVLIPRIGSYLGHVLSTALLVGAILVVSFVYFSRTPIDYSQGELLVVGVLWTVLTVGFEFVVGHVEGTPVSVTLGQYNVLAGQVWIAVPLTLLFAPLLFGWYLSS